MLVSTPSSKPSSPPPDSVSEALTDAREGACDPLRSLEIGRGGLGGDGKPWRIGTEVYGDRDILPRDVISRKLSVPNAERIFFVRHALRAQSFPTVSRFPRAALATPFCRATTQRSDLP